MAHKLTLISHLLCPYVQRAAIVLNEKGAAFERTDIDLQNKPDWFYKISPLGKTPVLVVDGEPIFESAVICEYLDETIDPRLHPDEPLERARHRAWIEFGSVMLNTIWLFMNAPDEETLLAKSKEIHSQLLRLEDALDDGPYFTGSKFCMVDAVFGPVFRYFDVFDSIDDFGFFEGMKKVPAWKTVLLARPSIQKAVRQDYPEQLRNFILSRHSALSKRIEPPA